MTHSPVDHVPRVVETFCKVIALKGQCNATMNKSQNATYLASKASIDLLDRLFSPRSLASLVVNTYVPEALFD